MLVKEPAYRLCGFYTDSRTRKMLHWSLCQWTLEEEEHVLVSAVFGKSQTSQGCCAVPWRKRRVSSMWKCSLLERQFSKMSQNQRWTLYLEFLVFREKRGEKMSVFSSPFGNRNMYDHSGGFDSTDMESPFCILNVRKRRLWMGRYPLSRVWFYSSLD